MEEAQIKGAVDAATAKFVSGHALVIDGGITVGEFRQGEGAAFAGVLQAVGVDSAAIQTVLASLSAQPN